jgi:hypothetical protein
MLPEIIKTSKNQFAKKKLRIISLYWGRFSWLWFSLHLRRGETLKENLIADRIAYVVHHSLEDKQEPTSKTRKNTHLFFLKYSTFSIFYERYCSQSNPLLTSLNMKDLSFHQSCSL